MDTPAAPSRTELRCPDCGLVTLPTSLLTIIDSAMVIPGMPAGVEFTCPVCAQIKFQELGRRERAALLAAGARITVSGSERLSGTSLDFERPQTP